MTTIDLPRSVRDFRLRRRLVLAGVILAFVAASVVALWPYEASKECRGAFSAAFRRDFDVRRCDLVVKRTGVGVVVRIPL
jgi:hypothetical protein